MGANKSAGNTPMPHNFRPNLSAQAQKFEIFEKKLSLGVRSPYSFIFLAKNRHKNPPFLCKAKKCSKKIGQCLIKVQIASHSRAENSEIPVQHYITCGIV